MGKKIRRTLVVFLVLLFVCSPVTPQLSAYWGAAEADAAIKNLPTYSNSAYTTLNHNEPEFSEQEKKNTEAFETYSNLDKLGRCGAAYANICKEIMPTEKRGDISSVHPSGWQSNMGWERCHLIGFQLAGENANAKNLITGTHYFNVSGMLPFENMVDDYVDETGNHVLYRVTPYFEGKNLIASGVQMEAWSVEDNGDGICFNVYVFNVQPGSVIDYASGGIKKGDTKVTQYITDGNYSKEYKTTALVKKSKSFMIGCSAPGKITYTRVSGSKRLSVSKNGKVTIAKGTSSGTYKIKVKIKAAKTNVYKAKTISKTITVKVIVPNDKVNNDSSNNSTDASSETSASTPSGGTEVNTTYILNINTKVFHLPTCSSVKQMSEKNKKTYTGTKSGLISLGYKSCGRCKP